MSLLDAILLDPARLDFWIARRTDGVKGSGTEDDPYDGSTRATPIISATIASSGTTATATATNHGFKNGDRVLIAGATGADAWYYNGTFPISYLDADTFQYTMRGDPPGPAIGTITCRLDPYLLDAVMNSLPDSPPVTVHIGPGVFETKGFSPFVTGGWQPKPGQKIIGSGMEVTVLKLVAAPAPNATYWAIGAAGHLDWFEASDFTVDCNLAGQAMPDYLFPPISCAGISVSGSYLSYRRIRVINFGSLHIGLECFVLWSAGSNPDGNPDPKDCVVEDCIIEQPAINNHAINTCINMGGSERALDGVMAYHRACVIRSCVIDCEYRDNPVAISGIAFDPITATATVTTGAPHGRLVNDWVRISGAVVNGFADNPFNGSFKITAVSGSPSNQFQYIMASTPSAAPTGDMWVGRFSSHIVAITGLTATQVPMTNDWEVVITTAAPHFRVPGGNVSVQAVETVQNQNPSQVKYNASFKVEDVSPWDPKKLKFMITSTANPGDWFPSGFVGVFLQGLGADAGTAAVVEGNRVFNSRIGGPYHDTWSTKDLIVRNNHYRSVAAGPYQNMGKTSEIKLHNTTLPNDRIKRTGDGKAALFTTEYDHGFVMGQAVHITGAEVQGLPPEDVPYNGYFKVDTTPALNQFTYLMDANPGFDAKPSPVPQFAALWQTGSIIIENNVIELISSANGWGLPIAIALANYTPNQDLDSQPIFKRVVIRSNVIRHVDQVSDPSGNPLGILLDFCAGAIVEDNVIDLSTPAPILHANCDQVAYFNNTNPAGVLIQGVDIGQTGNPKQRELTTSVEDAYLLAL